MNTKNGPPMDGKAAPAAVASKLDDSDMSNEKANSIPNDGSNEPTQPSTTPEDDDHGYPRANVFDSQDFMNFLATQVDVANLMVETKDGQRFSASFSGPSKVPGGLAPPAGLSEGPPSSVFRSLDMLKSLDSVGGDAPDPNVFQSTVSLEYFPPNPNVVVTKPAASSGGPASLGSDPFTSSDWATDYKSSHVEVSYTDAFDPKAAAGENGSSLPPKKRAPGTNWDAMFKQALAPLVDAASVAQREHSKAPELDDLKNSASVGNGQQSAKKRSNRRKPRKIIPESKEYVEFTEKDVLFGRGGRSNHHQGNKVYRDIVTQQQAHYRSCDKNEKTKVAQNIVDHVQQTIGGRFLELDKDANRWYLVPNVVARRKVGQALRENNTEEARAVKRAKYQGKVGAASKKAAEVAAAAAHNLKMQQAAALSTHV